MTRRQGRRRKKLLDDLKDRRGYCHLKEEALDRNMWRNRFGRGFEPAVRLLDDDEVIIHNIWIEHNVYGVTGRRYIRCRLLAVSGIEISLTAVSYLSKTFSLDDINHPTVCITKGFC